MRGVGRRGVSETIGPFDDDGGVVAGEDARAFEIGALIETVGVDVDEREGRAGVLVGEHVGGARDGAAIDAERAGDAADEAGLTGAEVADEQDGVARAEDCAEALPGRFGRFDGVALENVDLSHQWSHPASAMSMVSVSVIRAAPSPSRTRPIREAPSTRSRGEVKSSS